MMKNSYGKTLTFYDWLRYYLPYRLGQWWREFRWKLPRWLWKPKTKLVEQVDADWQDF